MARPDYGTVARKPSEKGPFCWLRGASGAPVEGLEMVLLPGLLPPRPKVGEPLRDRLQWGKERCESGRIGLTANELTWETGSEGSNPSLSANIAPAAQPPLEALALVVGRGSHQ
jgi:hypothetical protein